jgi:predicted secreted protein
MVSLKTQASDSRLSMILSSETRSQVITMILEEFEMILNDQDRSSIVEVGIQTLVTVRLVENPTTGYVWKVETAEGLELISDNFEKESDALGASGTRIFQFRASEVGSHYLSIRKWREWEGENSIKDRFYATVVVK